MRQDENGHWTMNIDEAERFLEKNLTNQPVSVQTELNVTKNYFYNAEKYARKHMKVDDVPTNIKKEFRTYTESIQDKRYLQQQLDAIRAGDISDEDAQAWCEWDLRFQEMNIDELYQKVKFIDKEEPYKEPAYDEKRFLTESFMWGSSLVLDC